MKSDALGINIFCLSIAKIVHTDIMAVKSQCSKKTCKGLENNKNSMAIVFYAVPFFFQEKNVIIYTLKITTFMLNMSDPDYCR